MDFLQQSLYLIERITEGRSRQFKNKLVNKNFVNCNRKQAKEKRNAKELCEEKDKLI